ncbi:MAG: tRNA (adenosine(37)-N6)-threonylcarbamoyltransferase complex transferase subunit TsaD [Bacteroidota bacterium]|nr:tRNA (adenosine(37)-N6)-threonylcarbamoyltransferase complex transferase subunit TsaD [Bacteroidota bacterium]
MTNKDLKDIIILGIESSCDDTSAAIVRDGYVLSNVMATQDVHKKYGGVVPELASRAHQQNIIPVVDDALKTAGISIESLSGVAFTRGPGLLGSLLVGTSFAKGLALARNVPLIEVNHLQAHILAHFIYEKDKETKIPKFPFLCMLVSGGHTQLVVMQDYMKMEIIGQTIDDAAGEAFDKCAKIIGLPYPGGPLIDKLAADGDQNAFQFSKPRIPNFDYSFSGLKTSFLYFLRDELKKNPDFIQENKNNIAASLQKTIIDILMHKLILASEKTGIKEIGIAGGVSANSGLRNALLSGSDSYGWKVHLPEFRLTTDNAAMIAINGYYKFLKGEFTDHTVAPDARWKF